jgi:predicted histone-like DNA-binding protein
MAFKFKVTGKKDPRNPQAAAKFYAIPVYNETKDLRQIANQIAEICAVNTPDTLAVMEALLRVLTQNLMEGHNVKLGDFGGFRLSLKCDPAATADKFTADHIKDVKVLFRPGRVFKESMHGFRFEKA